MADQNNPTPPPQSSPSFQFKVPFGFNLVSIQGLPTPFAFRPNHKSDIVIIRSIFEFQEYALPIPNFQPKLILDCGANIGCAAVYFANIYPNAQIYSVEPEKNNFKMLQYNTVCYENIHAINSALWDKETSIKVLVEGRVPLDYMTVETTEDDPAAFRTVTVSKLLQDSGFEEIDLLKIDIEGAEKEVFSGADVDEWLPKVKVLTIELHDRMKKGCSYEFFKAVSKYHWHFAFRGENLIFIREDTLGQ